MKPPTERFSERVDDYVRYRPSYPEAAIDALVQTCRLREESLIVDLGSGTGAFTRLLLDRDLCVIAVEPNQEMRRAGEKILSGYERFTSVSGTAEQTGLPDSSVDLVVAAQAFHWFQPEPTRSEFKRILKDDGWVALVWNQRRLAQPIQRDYDALLRKHAPEYESVSRMNTAEGSLRGFFSEGCCRDFAFENSQILDRTEFVGRMQSASYTPLEGSPGYLALMSAADELFSWHEEGGMISFEYTTRLFVGKL